MALTLSCSDAVEPFCVTPLPCSRRSTTTASFAIGTSEGLTATGKPFGERTLDGR